MPYQYYEENSKNKKIRVLVGFYIPVAYLIDEGDEGRGRGKGRVEMETSRRAWPGSQCGRASVK